MAPKKTKKSEEKETAVEETSAEVEEKSEKHTPKASVTWVNIKPAEVEALVVDFGKKGMSLAQIGLVLRDSHSVPSVKAITGKKISQILDSHKIPYTTQLDVFNGKTTKLKKHMGTHTHDYTATKALNKHMWVVHKLERQ